MSDLDTWREIIEMKRQLRRLQTGEYLTTGSWQTAISVYLTLPELRGFWPFSSVNESGNIIDLSGQGRTLTNNGSTTRTMMIGGFPYSVLNGSSQWFSRADEAGLDITGAITFGAWVWGLNITGARGMIGKSGVAGTSGGYQLYLSGGAPTMFIEDSTGAYVQIAAPAAIPTGTWTFVAGRFYPSNNIMVQVDEQFTDLATPSTANIRNNAMDFKVGAFGNPVGSYFDGAIALPFVCARELPKSLMLTLYRQTRVVFGV